MAECIERKKAIAYAPLPKHLREYQTMNLDDAWEDGYDFAIRQIESIPAADVRPVVRGEWEKFEDFDEYGGGRYVEWTCSECFYKVKGGWAVSDSHIDEKPRENFCSNCGADMRGETR